MSGDLAGWVAEANLAVDDGDRPTASAIQVAKAAAARRSMNGLVEAGLVTPLPSGGWAVSDPV